MWSSSIVLAIAGLVVGVLAACYWWAASQVDPKWKNGPPEPFPDDYFRPVDPVDALSGDVLETQIKQTYWMDATIKAAERSARSNKIAAGLTGVAVVLSGASGVVGALAASRAAAKATLPLDIGFILQGMLWGLLVVFLALRAWERYTNKYWAQWFRPGRSVWKDELEWSEIQEMLDRDPLNSTNWLRGKGVTSFFRDVIVLVAGIILFLMITGSLFWGYRFPFVQSLDKDSLDKLPAAVAAILALAGVLYTIRAKVRSENRQKWINEVRQHLAIVINYAGYKNAVRDNSPDPQRFESPQGPHLYPQANLARLTLELLINPSEKDHRTLSTLLRLLCGSKLLDDIDTEVTNNLPCLMRDNHDHRKLITWTVRLSNAMLKREWELVKFGK